MYTSFNISRESEPSAVLIVWRLVPLTRPKHFLKFVLNDPDYTKSDVNCCQSYNCM